MQDLTGSSEDYQKQLYFALFLLLRDISKSGCFENNSSKCSFHIRNCKMGLTANIKWTVIGGINFLLVLASIGSVSFGSYLINKFSGVEALKTKSFGLSAPLWLIVLGMKYGRK